MLSMTRLISSSETVFPCRQARCMSGPLSSAMMSCGSACAASSPSATARATAARSPVPAVAENRSCHLGLEAAAGTVHHGQRDAGDGGQRDLVGEGAQLAPQPRTDRGDRIAEKRQLHSGHRVEHELLGPWPVPVGRGPAHPGLPGDALVGDRGRPFARQQLAGRVQHRLAAAGLPGISGGLHCVKSRRTFYETA